MADLDPIIKEKIIALLTQNGSEWAHASEIAKHIGHNRITIGKYLEVLRAQELVQTKQVAQAKLWKLADQKKPLVLIVDDEPAIVELIKLTLGEDKYILKSANNGLDALLLVSEQNPALIILDVMMPKMSGIDVCQKLKENPKTRHIPILIVSAKTASKDKIAGITVGADEYITKPFDPLELEARVQTLIRRSTTNAQSSEHFFTEQRNALRFEIQKQKTISVLQVSLTKFDDFQKMYGYKRASETMTLIIRLLTHCASISDSQYMFAQYSATQFVIVAQKSSEIRSCIQAQFHSLLPFFYNDLDCSLTNKSEVTCVRNGKTMVIPVISLQITEHLSQKVTPQLIEKLGLI